MSILSRSEIRNRKNRTLQLITMKAVLREYLKDPTISAINISRSVGISRRYITEIKRGAIMIGWLFPYVTEEGKRAWRVTDEGKEILPVIDIDHPLALEVSKMKSLLNKQNVKGKK